MVNIGSSTVSGNQSWDFCFFVVDLPPGQFGLACFSENRVSVRGKGVGGGGAQYGFRS